MYTPPSPLDLVLMELSEQLHPRILLLSVVWRPRDENEEADALTNEDFGAFDPARRVAVRWEDLDFLVLPRLAGEAERSFRHVRELKAQRSGGLARRPERRRKRLRDAEPW